MTTDSDEDKPLQEIGTYKSCSILQSDEMIAQPVVSVVLHYLPLSDLHVSDHEPPFPLT